MPIKRKYFEDENFVLTLIYGKLTRAELGQHVIEMNNEHKDKAGVNELADCRWLTDISELTTTDVVISAEMEREKGRTCGSKGAIVVASDTVYGLARAYATIAQEARVDSRVYRSMDEAIKWLEVDCLREQIAALSDEIACKR